MNNKHGYTMSELIILCALLAIVFAISITKVSFAYQEATNETELEEEETNLVKQAAEIYVKAHTKDLKKDDENFIYGKDLIAEGFLIQTEDFDYSNTKIKITYQEDKKNYLVQVGE